MAVKKSSFDITSLLNTASLEEANEKRLKVHYKQLTPHPANHYSLEKIEELANDIESFGLLAEILVKAKPDGSYVIVSGHRRVLAIKTLVEERGLTKFEDIPCKLLPSDEDETVTELKLHVSNMSAREMSEYDKMAAISEYKRLLNEAKQKGIEVKGNIAEIISDTVNLGTTQVKKYIAVDKNASDETKEALKNGDITFEEAYVEAKNSKAKKKPVAEKEIPVSIPDDNVNSNDEKPDYTESVDSMSGKQEPITNNITTRAILYLDTHRQDADTDTLEIIDYIIGVLRKCDV